MTVQYGLYLATVSLEGVFGLIRVIGKKTYPEAAEKAKTDAY